MDTDAVVAKKSASVTGAAFVEADAALTKATKERDGLAQQLEKKNEEVAGLKDKREAALKDFRESE